MSRQQGWQDGAGLVGLYSHHYCHSPGFLLPRSSGKEEALCQLREENQRLSREQERVSRVGGRTLVTDGQGWGQGCQGPGWLAQVRRVKAEIGLKVMGYLRGAYQTLGAWQMAWPQGHLGTELTFHLAPSWLRS